MDVFPSKISIFCEGDLTRTNPEPPIDPKKGSATQAMMDAARHASTALPPARATFAAASAPGTLPAAAASRGVDMAEPYLRS
jgi:hypothetical protein